MVFNYTSIYTNMHNVLSVERGTEIITKQYFFLIIAPQNNHIF